MKIKSLKAKIFFAIIVLLFYLALSLNPIILKNKILCINSNLSILNNNLDSFVVQNLCSTKDIKRGYQKSSAPKDNEGLFFVLGLPSEQAFWMKDVDFDLTLVYLDSAYHIVAIHLLKAHDETPISSPANTAYALEVNAKYLSKFKIDEQLIINKASVK